METQERLEQIRKELAETKRLLAEVSDYFLHRNLGQTADDLRVKVTRRICEINTCLG